MSFIGLSQQFEKRHVALAARLAGVQSSLFLPRKVQLVDSAEQAAAREGTVAVARGTRASLAGPSGAFTYDDPQAELALAGLIARIAAEVPGAPVAADPISLSVLALADRLARTDVPALLTGATGTGKEVLARFIHARSPRSNRAFVGVNCAAIPETMLEAMLFGHEKGAFTGASAGGKGLLREADGGTLLLDEIAEMPLGLQAKLLRALQEGEVLPVGATKAVPVDVRIVAAANRDLPTEVAEGRFREDLFYRLNVFPIHLSSLRERQGDIAPLACAMLLRHRGPVGPHRIAPAALARLRAHPWPGNVRELENVVRRALVLAQGSEEIGAADIVFDLPARIGGAVEMPIAQEAPADAPLSAIVQVSQAKAIYETLRACGGRRVDAARRLGISERTLRYRLASFREAGMDAGAVL